MAVKLLSAMLGPEMGASILWTPGKMRSFCRKTHVHKISRFRGDFGFWRGGGGGSADCIFMGARIFLIITESIRFALKQTSTQPGKDSAARLFP